MALCCSLRGVCLPALRMQHANPLPFTRATMATRRTNVKVQDSNSGATTAELASEFTGSALFQIIGGAAPAALAAPANGLGLMAMSVCPPALHMRHARALPFTKVTMASRRINITVQDSNSGATTTELASEFTGSALLQIIGGAAPAALAAPANGLGVMAMIFAFGGTSGAHLNPAISLMLLLRGKISGPKALAYMATQVAGCVLGALMCCWLIPGVTAGQGLGAPGTFAPAAGLGSAGVFAWEALMTAALGLVVYGCAVVNSAFKAAAPIGIGVTVTSAIMAAGQYSGCVINPARALGPAIVFGMSMGTVAVYVAGQLAGGALAAVLAGLIHKE